MKKPVTALLALTLSAGWLAVPLREAEACTTFCLRRGPALVFGKNYDWVVPDGLLFVNKRGVAKTALLPPGERPASWVSKYGSLTFNQYGREFPNGGMNEAGLVVEVMWLDETQYPAPDGRPALDCLEWVQYQLDNFATVAAVVRQVGGLRVVADATVHYLVCDKSGACASVEFLDGKAVYHTGRTMPVQALANHTYAESLRFLERHRADPDALKGRGSLERFARAATLVERAGTGKPPVEEAFEVLDRVAQGDYTKWSIVYDLRQRRVHWRTLGNRAVRQVDLSRLDFSCSTPVRLFDIDAGATGDATGRFTDYMTERNRRLVTASVRKTDFLAEVPAEEVSAVARHPESTSCRAEPSTRRSEPSSREDRPQVRRPR